MKASKKLRSIDVAGVPPGAAGVTAEFNPGSNNKNENHFLYPKMPGSFLPYKIKKMSITDLRARYVQVFSASMGNHSLALFYCCWTEDQFDAAMTDGFQRDIERARAQLADRATFILYRGMGLIQSEEPVALPTVTAAMAKVVESFGAPADKGGKGAPKKGYKLIVDGLARPEPPGAVPPADGPKRGPGRPRKDAGGAAA